MNTTIQNIVVRSWGLMMRTSQTWEDIKNDTNNENSFKKYFIPLLVTCALIVLIFKIIYADSKLLQTGLVYAVVTALAYMGAFYLTRYFLTSYIKKNHLEKNAPVLQENLISYSFTVVFAIKLITTVIPSLFFLQILNVYTIYIVWEGCRTLMFEMDEDERGKIMLIVGLSIMFAPAVITKVVLFMLPGF